MKFIKPMKCKSFEDGKHSFIWNGHYAMEQKFDGYRCQFVNGESLSGSGKPLGYEVKLNCNAQLDGELIVDPRLGIPDGHAEVAHWLAHDQSKLVVVLFDVMDNGGDVKSCRWTERRKILEDIHARIGNNNLWMSQLVWDDKKAIYDKLVNDGKEGAVFKNVDSEYVPGSRAANWVKMKAWDSVDVVITDCDAEPTEWRVRPGQVDKQTGLVSVEGVHAENWGSFVGLSYGYYDPTGKLVRVGSTGQTGPKEEMERFVGMVGAYKSYGRVNATGALNHPVFLEWRNDKLPTDCVFDFSEGAML